jgi:T-complex protein 1 subunit delta
LSPIAVDAVLKIIDTTKDVNADLRDIKIVKKLGGTIEDTELIEGLVFTNQKPSQSAGGPTRVKDAKIALIQFCLSSPKTEVENSVVVKDYTAMDRILKEERKYIANRSLETQPMNSLCISLPRRASWLSRTSNVKTLNSSPR